MLAVNEGFLHFTMLRLRSLLSAWPRTRRAAPYTGHGVRWMSAVRSVNVNGTALRFEQHFFDDPVAQPRQLPRRADLTGLKLWPTALKILDKLQEQRAGELFEAAASEGRRLRVLELGSGVGVLGLSVAALGRADVVVTDPNIKVNFSETVSGSSLELLQRNVDTNRLALDAVGSVAVAHELEWSNEAHADALHAACLHDGSEFDLVLGSELLYDPDQYDSLLRTLCRFANDRRTVAVLGFTHRHGVEDRFLQRAVGEGGFQLERESFAAAERSSAWTLATLCRL
jgi:hypothetical protein